MPRSDSLKTLFQEVRDACREHADPARAAKYARFFVEGYDAYGVDFQSPEWTAKMKAWTERCMRLGLDRFLKLGEMLTATGKYEEASVAILILKEFREQYSRETFDGIARWFDGGIRNWGHTDVLCGEVLGDFLKRGIVPLKALGAWRDSPHKFQRRAAPVMMLALLKDAKDYHPLLEVIRPMMHDGEKVVRQGLGWFLREAWKIQPAVVEPFLLEFKDTAPRLIYQYATEKMSAGQKEKFRAAKKAGAS